MASLDGTGVPQPPRTKRGLIAAVAAAVLVLAVVGATAGWILAGRANTNVADPGGSPTPSATSVAPTTSAAATTPTVDPTADTGTGNPGPGFPLPDVSNTDFEQARKQLRELRLGVNLVFGQSGDDRTVSRTEPAAGQTVRRGITVKLYVRGTAPYATIPEITGKPCGQVGTIVADHGLVPQYPTGRSGVVLRTDPEPAPNRLRWNETLRVYCGTPTASPAPA